MNPQTLNHIKTSLVGYFPEQNYDFEAFAKETAIYIDLFRHVFNSELDESNSFKSFVQNMTDEQLANIDYVRMQQNEIKRLRKPIKSAKMRELKSAFKKHIVPSANQNDNLNFFFKLWTKRRSYGRPRKRFDRLELKCFEMLAFAYEKYTAKQPSAGGDSLFPVYVTMCVKETSGDLINIHDLSRMYLSHIYSK